MVVVVVVEAEEEGVRRTEAGALEAVSQMQSNANLMKHVACGIKVFAQIQVCAVGAMPANISRMVAGSAGSNTVSVTTSEGCPQDWSSVSLTYCLIIVYSKLKYTCVWPHKICLISAVEC